MKRVVGEKGRCLLPWSHRWIQWDDERDPQSSRFKRVSDLRSLQPTMITASVARSRVIEVRSIHRHIDSSIRLSNNWSTRVCEFVEQIGLTMHSDHAEMMTPVHL